MQEDPAADATTEGSKALAILHEKWPVQGKVEFDGYAASYRPGILPDVLRCLTFTVLPREKVSFRKAYSLKRIRVINLACSCATFLSVAWARASRDVNRC